MQHAIPRRKFMGSVGAGLAGLAFSGCQSSHQQVPAIEAGNPALIDTHTHFYDPSRPQGVPWPPRNDTVLYRSVYPQDYLALPTPRKVTGTVVVEASPWLKDNQWVLDLAAAKPFIVGFVGNLPVGTPGFASHLKHFSSNPLFRGIRIRGVNLSAALQRKTFVEDLKRLSESGLSLDLVGSPELLSSAGQLAGTIPELRLVIDHLAGVHIDGGPPPQDWSQAMQALAENPNVSCKVSGLVEGTGRRGGQAPAHLEFYHPVLDIMWNLFGPDRLIYGSNWPVCEHFASLETVQRIVLEYFSEKGEEPLAKVFWKNAKTVYGWVDRQA